MMIETRLFFDAIGIEMNKPKSALIASMVKQMQGFWRAKIATNTWDLLRQLLVQFLKTPLKK